MADQKNEHKPLSSGENVVAGFAYVGLTFFFIPTIVIFLLKKDESDYIKFHCLQAFSFAIYTAISFLLQAFILFTSILASVIPGLNFLMGLVGVILYTLLGLTALPLLIYFVFVMVKTFQGETVRIPVVADFIDANFNTLGVNLDVINNARKAKSDSSKPKRPNIFK